MRLNLTDCGLSEKKKEKKSRAGLCCHESHTRGQCSPQDELGPAAMFTVQSWGKKQQHKNKAIPNYSKENKAQLSMIEGNICNASLK